MNGSRVKSQSIKRPRQKGIGMPESTADRLAVDAQPTRKSRRVSKELQPIKQKEGVQDVSSAAVKMIKSLRGSKDDVRVLDKDKRKKGSHSNHKGKVATKKQVKAEISSSRKEIMLSKDLKKTIAGGVDPVKHRPHGSEVKDKPKQGSGVKDKTSQGSRVKDRLTQGSGVKDKPTQGSGVKDRLKQRSEVKDKPTQGSGVKDKPKQRSEVKDKPTQGSGVKDRLTQGSGVKDRLTQGSGIKDRLTQGIGVQNRPAAKLSLKRKLSTEISLKPSKCSIDNEARTSEYFSPQKRSSQIHVTPVKLESGGYAAKRDQPKPKSQKVISRLKHVKNESKESLLEFDMATSTKQHRTPKSSSTKSKTAPRHDMKTKAKKAPVEYSSAAKSSITKLKPKLAELDHLSQHSPAKMAARIEQHGEIEDSDSESEWEDVEGKINVFASLCQTFIWLLAQMEIFCDLG